MNENKAYPIIDLNHIGINVKSIERSTKFYRDVLGFMQLGECIDQKESFCKCQYLKMPGGVILELIEYYPNKKYANLNMEDTGMYKHMAFTVEDRKSLELLKERFMKAKADFPEVELTFGPAYLPYLDLDLITIIDPNGVEIEFCRKRNIGRYDFPQNLVK